MMKRKDKKSTGYSDSHTFTIEQVTVCLDPIVGHTLGEVDRAGVFERTKNKPKITGIAGDVIEQSVLGYGANSDKSPDILIDGVETEVKVTGIRESKDGGKNEYEAKEPMSITAVSVDDIVKEEFLDSAFFHKIDQMLIVYYLYDSDETVPAAEYARFPIKGYDIHRFDSHDLDILMRDWTMVRDFIREIQSNYDDPGEGYPRLSNELRDRLMYIDTAPKWPNPPRFRFKRALVTEIVRRHFSRSQKVEGSETLDGIGTFEDLDRMCSEVTERYRGHLVDDFIDIFGIDVKDRDKLNKSIAESIVIRMFGGNVGKMRDVDIFRKTGVVAKTVCLKMNGGLSEDVKLMPVDLDEFFDEGVDFEDSLLHDYLSGSQFLWIIFQETDSDGTFRYNQFKGIKRLSLPLELTETEAHRTWEDARATVHNGELKETVCMKKDGTPRLNKSGTVMTSINLPKSRDHALFFRGTGSDSRNKSKVLCGIKVYKQDIWIHKPVVVKLLEDTGFL